VTAVGGAAAGRGGARRPLRIATVQCTPVTGDLAGNAQDHAVRIAEAAERGARIVLFPQLSLVGYDPDLIDLHRLRVVPQDPALAPIQAACRAASVHALVGAPVAEPRPMPVGGGLSVDGPPRIGMLHVDPAGRVRLAYVQRFLSTGEIGIFGAGQNDAIVTIDGWRVGLALGRDAAVPEHATRLAYAGAEVYAVGGWYPIGAEERMRSQLAAAAANGLWTVLAQFVGGTGGGPACGGSGAWAPGGSPVLDLRRDPRVGIVEIASGAAGSAGSAGMSSGALS
jgi:predicted amidohydrolase